MDKFFKLKESGTTVSREIMAGVTTFFAMSYILFVNPSILSQTGMPYQAVFLATIIASIIGTLIREVMPHSGISHTVKHIPQAM